MLGSVTPLGERGRVRWWITASAYLVGSLVGGALFGGIVAAVGWARGRGWPTSARLATIAVAW